MKHFIIAVYVLAPILVFGQNRTITEKDLIGYWIDSREENTKNTDQFIFRPKEFKKFPSSRFRFTMQLQPNNTCTYLHLASNDTHKLVTGTWKLKGNILKIYDPTGSLTKKWEIKKVSKEILIVENSPYGISFKIK